MLLKQLLSNAVTFTQQGDMKLAMVEQQDTNGAPLLSIVIEGIGEGITSRVRIAR